MKSYLSYFNFKDDPFPEYGDRKAEKVRLSLRNTATYIRQSLIGAGVKGTIFDADAIRMIYKSTKGNVILIDTLCDFALNRAFFLELQTIDKDLILECLELLLESKPAETYKNEKRKHMRLYTNFLGTFHILGTQQRGKMTVTNISLAGMRVRFNQQRLVKPRDKVRLIFTLDDEKKTDIRMVVVICNIFGYLSGCTFRGSENVPLVEYVNFKLGH